MRTLTFICYLKSRWICHMFTCATFWRFVLASWRVPGLAHFLQQGWKLRNFKFSTSRWRSYCFPWTRSLKMHRLHTFMASCVVINKTKGFCVLSQTYYGFHCQNKWGYFVQFNALPHSAVQFYCLNVFFFFFCSSSYMFVLQPLWSVCLNPQPPPDYQLIFLYWITVPNYFKIIQPINCI